MKDERHFWCWQQVKKVLLCIEFFLSQIFFEVQNICHHRKILSFTYFSCWADVSRPLMLVTAAHENRGFLEGPEVIIKADSHCKDGPLVNYLDIGCGYSYQEPLPNSLLAEKKNFLSLFFRFVK